MSMASQRRARDLARLEAAPEPDTLETLERRVDDLERRLGALDLRLADAFAAERQNVRVKLDQLRADLDAGKPPKSPARRTPKRTAAASNSKRK